MSNWLVIPVAFLLLADEDVAGVKVLLSPANPSPTFPSDEEIPLFPNGGPSSDTAQSQGQSQSKSTLPGKNATLQETSKLALIRYVSGEFAKAIKPLPAGKQGFHVAVRKPLGTEMLDRAVATHGPAVGTGHQGRNHNLEVPARPTL